MSGAGFDPACQAIPPMQVHGDPPQDIPRRIRAAAQRDPGKTALIAGEMQWSAADLVDRMDRIAALLHRDGLRQGDVIATLAGATADHLLLYLGAAALGVGVAPLPSSAHPDAIMRMLENSGASAVFAESGAPALPAGLPGHRDLADAVASAARCAPLPPRDLPPDLMFDIIYSSGTTGAPKGIEHDILFRDRQVLRFVRFGLDAQAVVLFSTPLYSNTTLATLIPALSQGSTVVLMAKFDAGEFLRLSQAHRVTHAMMVPVQVQRIIDHPAFGDHDLSSYRAKLSTSAPLPPPLLRQVLDRWPGRMINIYGMTEGGVSAVLDCTAHPDKVHTVGKAGPGAEIRVIDAEGNTLPSGQTGEIVGRSTTMMRGYRNAPDVTRAALWTSPEGDIFIRSGDMGRFDEDGFLVLLDRRKDMIISGGFNIFAADIEAVVAEHPQVRDVAVIGVPSERWGETPVACVVLGDGATVTAADLLAWANERLGRMQRLAAVAALPDLPRSAIGKVLKRELRDAWQDLRTEDSVAHV